MATPDAATVLNALVEDRKLPGSDLDRASGQELVDRDATIRLPVIDDVPAQRMRIEAAG